MTVGQLDSALYLREDLDLREFPVFCPGVANCLAVVRDPGPSGFLVFLLRQWDFTSASPLGAADLCLGPGDRRIS